VDTTRHCDLFPGDTAFANYTQLLKRVISLIPALLAYYKALEALCCRTMVSVKKVCRPYYWSLISPHTSSTEASNQAEVISLYGE